MGSSSSKSSNEVVNEAITNIMVKKSASITQSVNQSTVVSLCGDIFTKGDFNLSIGNNLEWKLDALVAQLNDISVAREITQEIEQVSKTKSNKLVRLFEFDKSENNNRIENIVHTHLKDITETDLEQSVSQVAGFTTCEKDGYTMVVGGNTNLDLRNTADGISRARVIQSSVQDIADELDNYANQQGITESTFKLFDFLGIALVVIAAVVAIIALWFGACRLTTMGAKKPADCDTLGCPSAFKSKQCKGMDVLTGNASM